MTKNANSQKKILWVDDDFETVPMYSVAEYDYPEKGFDVVIALNPDEALSYGNDVFDCIILDVAMPTGNSAGVDLHKSDGGRKTGLLFIQTLYEKAPNTPIIVYSVVQNCQRLFIDAEVDQYVKEFVSKSDCTELELIDKIKKVLEKGQ